MKTLSILSIILVSALTVQAQNFEDITKFGRVTNFGTARSAAMGGAFSALGGDLSAITNNPAGVGVFRKSEINFSPLLNFNTTKSGFGEPQKTSFQVGNLGAAIAFYSPASDWKGINFSINYTNLNNFNRNTSQLVGASYNSWTDALAAQAKNTPSDELDGYTTSLAYATYLINYDEEKSQYFSVLGLSPTHEYVTQQKEITEKGNQGEYTFSFGTNYKDKLYLGASIGIQSIQYKMSSVYVEAPDADSPSGLDYFQFNDYAEMSGVGTNVKVGLIYRPIPELRIGASIHSPTWYNMSYRMSTYMQSTFITDYDPITLREGFFFEQPSGEFNVDYDMKSPWRAIVGVATMLGQKAIISADYEFVKYPSSQFGQGSDGYSYATENQLIKDYLRPTHNFRAGAEFRVNSTLSLRAGYSFWDSPYYEAVKKSNNRIQSVSAGAGLNFGSFYCDAAYVYKYMKNQTQFYGYNDIVADPVFNKNYTSEARLSLGLRF